MSTIGQSQKHRILKLPKSKAEERHDEYGKARKGITLCKKCHNMLFKKEWHRYDPLIIRQIQHTGKEIRRGICPACAMVEEHLYEGELLVEDPPRGYRTEITRIIHGFSKRAELHDPQDRIIKIERRNGGYRVTTTENQMAVRLAKKIRDSFRNLHVKISYSREPYENDRVIITF